MGMDHMGESYHGAGDPHHGARDGRGDHCDVHEGARRSHDGRSRVTVHEGNERRNTGAPVDTTQRTSALKSTQSLPLKPDKVKQSDDVFYSDSPRFLNKRFLAPGETTVSELDHPMCLCPAAPIRPEALRRMPPGKHLNMRDFAWLLQKLTGSRLNKVRMTETILLSNGKPLSIFFHKDGKLQNTRFRVSTELYITMRQWLLKTAKVSSQRQSLEASPQRDPTWGLEVCSLQFTDGASRTLAAGELELLLKQRKPKWSQWVETKIVQLLPNAGATFERPLQYITYHYNGKLSDAKEYMRHLAKEVRAAPQDKEVRVEVAVAEIQKLLDPLHIEQGDFYFAEKSKESVTGESIGIPYLLGASNLVVRKRKVTKREQRKEGVDTAVKCFDDRSFLDSIERHAPTKKMEGVLHQLQEYYYESQLERETSPRRRKCGGGSASPSPRSMRSVPTKPHQSYFSIEPPECPPSPRKQAFMLPPRPKSVGDLLGTSRSSTWFHTELQARNINSRQSKRLSRPQTTNAVEAHATVAGSAVFGTRLSKQLKQLRVDDSILSSTFFSKMLGPDAASGVRKWKPGRSALPRPKSTGALTHSRPSTQNSSGASLRSHARNGDIVGARRPKSFAISALLPKEISCQSIGDEV